MIDYQELVRALDAWRLSHGLPVSKAAAAAVAAAPSRARAASWAPPPPPPVAAVPAARQGTSEIEFGDEVGEELIDEESVAPAPSQVSGDFAVGFSHEESGATQFAGSGAQEEHEAGDMVEQESAMDDEQVEEATMIGAAPAPAGFDGGLSVKTMHGHEPAPSRHDDDGHHE